MSILALGDWQLRLLGPDAEERARALADLTALPSPPEGLRELLDPIARANVDPQWLSAATVLWQVYRDPAPAIEGLAAELFGPPLPDRSLDVLVLLQDLGDHAAPLAPMLARACTLPELAGHFGLTALCLALLRLGPAGIAELGPVLHDDDRRKALLMLLVEEVSRLTGDLSGLVPHLERFVNENFVSLAVAACISLWHITWRPQPYLFDLGPRDIGYLDTALWTKLGLVLGEMLPTCPEAAGPLRHLLGAMGERSANYDAATVLRPLLGGGLRGQALVAGLLARAGPAVLEALFDLGEGTPHASLFLGRARQTLREALRDADTPSTSLVVAASRLIVRAGPIGREDLTDCLRLFECWPNEAGGLFDLLQPAVRNRPEAARLALAELSRLCRLRETSGADAVKDASLQGVARVVWSTGRPALLEMLSEARVDDAAWGILSQCAPSRHDPHVRFLIDDAPRLAGMLASPRPALRRRMLRLVPYCPGLAQHIWPDLVAALSSSDAEMRDAVVPLFLDLHADLPRIIAELTPLLDESDAGRAAAARLALVLVGHGAEPPADEEAARQMWRELEEIANRGPIHANLRLLFFARLRHVPEEVLQRLRESLYTDALRPSVALDERFTAIVRGERGFDFSGVHAIVYSDPWWCEAAYGLVLHGGAPAYSPMKIPLIKAYRKCYPDKGLKDSKDAIEAAFDRLLRDDSPASRRAALAHLFPIQLPPRVSELLEHPLAWLRWCGLVVVEHWGSRGEAYRATLEMRLTDPAPAVREQAARALEALAAETT